MTTTSFKQGLQNDINYAGLVNKYQILSVSDEGCNTVITFTEVVTKELTHYLNYRFVNGVRLHEDDKKIIVNTPMDKIWYEANGRFNKTLTKLKD